MHKRWERKDMAIWLGTHAVRIVMIGVILGYLTLADKLEEMKKRNIKNPGPGGQNEWW